MAENNTPVFTVWIVGDNEPAQTALKRAGYNIRVLPEAEVLQPGRFVTAPGLVIISKEWSATFEAFTRSVGNMPVWLDLVTQTSRSLDEFQYFCQNKGVEGSTVELSPAELPWTIALIESYRSDQGSLLNMVPARENAPALIYSSRMVGPNEIGSRIDFLAKKNSDAPAMHWYSTVSSLASLALEIAAELKLGVTPVLSLYAGELADKHWLVTFHIPFAKRQQQKLPQIITRLRQDVALRNSLAFNFLTRECSALVATFTDNLIELGVVFQPGGVLGGAIGDANRTFREAIVFRRKQLTNKFVPSACTYSPFPEQEKRKDAAAVRLLEKAKQELTKIPTVGSDESFVAFLTGIEGTEGGADPRYMKLIALVDKIGSHEEGELMRDLFKRYFTLVEEAKARKTAARAA